MTLCKFKQFAMEMYNYFHDEDIHQLIRQRVIDIVSDIINKDRFNYMSDTGETPLIVALSCCYFLEVRLLLIYGADARVIYKNQSLIQFVYSLSYKCRPDIPDIIQLLIEYGADIHYQDDEGDTLLMTLLSFGDTTTLVRISQFSPEILGIESLRIQDSEGYTALHLGITNYIQRPELEEIIMRLINTLTIHDINILTLDGETFLSLALKNIDAHVFVPILIQKGAFVNSSLLDIAFLYGSSNDLISMVASNMNVDELALIYPSLSREEQDMVEIAFTPAKMDTFRKLLERHHNRLTDYNIESIFKKYL